MHRRVRAGAAVVVLDLETRQVVAKFPVAGLPIMTAIDEGRQRAFVSVLGGRGVNGSIAVYDLQALEEIEQVELVPFMVAAVPHREEVVMPLSRNTSLRFLHLDVSQTPARVLHDIEVPDVLTFPAAVTVSPDGRYAFVGAEVSRELLIVDLVDGGVQRRPWLDDMGPTALTVVP